MVTKIPAENHKNRQFRAHKINSLPRIFWTIGFYNYLFIQKLAGDMLIQRTYLGSPFAICWKGQGWLPEYSY
jgi:hypothetical protein